jgi:hypothetical protein
MHINLWHKTEPFHYHSHEVYLSPYIFFYLFLYRWKNWESNHTKTLYKQKTLTSSHTSQFQLFPLTSWSGHDFIISLFPPTTQLQYSITRSCTTSNKVEILHYQTHLSKEKINTIEKCSPKINHTRLISLNYTPQTPSPKLQKHI